MGANSAFKLFKVINNVNTLMSIELMNSAQAIELKGVKSSKIILDLIQAYRKHVPFVKEDVVLSPFILKGKEFIANYFLS